MDFQEHFSPAASSSDRSFGLVMAAFFALVAVWPMTAHGHPRYWALTAAVALVVIALAAPHLLARPNHLWTGVGRAMHAIVSPLALGVVFLLAIVPVGLLMRIFGKQPLPLRFESTKSSYWVTRDPPGPEPESFTNQF
jgi:hypothetical protein